MRLEDIAIVTNTPLTTDLALLEKFKHHDRVAYDPKTDLYSYKVVAGPGRPGCVLNKARFLARLQCPLQAGAAHRDPATYPQGPGSRRPGTQGFMEGSTTSDRRT